MHWSEDFFVELIWKMKCGSWFHTLNPWDDLCGFSNHPELHHNSYQLVNNENRELQCLYEPYIIGNQNLQFFGWILRESVRYVVCVDKKCERMRKNRNFKALTPSIWLFMVVEVFDVNGNIVNTWWRWGW